MTDAFRSYPQLYPKAFQTATRYATNLANQQKRAARSSLVSVVSTDFHLTAGYVLCQKETALVQVFGVPYGEVVPGSRLFVKQVGAQASNRAYLFEAHAPNLSSLGQSGSLLIQPFTPAVPLSSSPVVPIWACTATGGLPGIAIFTDSSYYYWYLFVYLAAIPASPATIFEMAATSGGTRVRLQYLPTGQLQFHSADGNGYTTTGGVAPHTVHWIVIQPQHTGSELLVDTIASVSGVAPTFAGGTTLYTLSLLSNTDGSSALPLGSWVSKFGYGATGRAGGHAGPFPNLYPEDDTELPTYIALSTSVSTNLGGLYSQALYLCEDASGTTAINSQTGAASGSHLTLADASLLNSFGPY